MSAAARPRVAVVGHAEWLTHGLGEMPGAGGGGCVSAAQVPKLGASGDRAIVVIGEPTSARIEDPLP